MVKEAKLTIIIPVYNVEKYLHQCIDSILSSSFKDFELILVDDGSTDDSGKICDEYAEKDDRVRVIHQSNGGVSKARNAGIDNARGVWVTFIDADDLISSSFLENMFHAVKEYPNIDYVQAGCSNYEKNGIIGIEQQYQNYVGDDKGFLFSHFRGLTISKLFRYDILKKKNIRFDERLCFAEDMLFTLDYIYYVEKYVFCDEVGYLYRRDNPTSLTSVPRTIPYDLSLYSFNRRYHGISAYICKHHLSGNCILIREQQLCDELLFTIYRLYDGYMHRSERLNHLRHDYTIEQLYYLRYCKGRTNRILFNRLLRNQHYKLFDRVTYSVVKGIGHHLRNIIH